MSYDLAITKAWLDLEEVTEDKTYAVNFLGDEYSVDLDRHTVLSLSCNIPAKEHIIVLVLHYLIQKIKTGLPKLTGVWVSFRQIEGGLPYYPTFKKRVIVPILRKYGDNPSGILDNIDRFNAKRVQFGDIGILIEVFAGVPIVVTLSKADEEFPADANILFDESITDIFVTEDIVVICDCIAAGI